MRNDNCNNIFENMGRFVLKVSEGMAKIVEGINVMASSEALKAFVEFLQKIPDDIKDTQFFGKVQFFCVSQWKSPCFEVPENGKK